MNHYAFFHVSFQLISDVIHLHHVHLYLQQMAKKKMDSLLFLLLQ